MPTSSSRPPNGRRKPKPKTTQTPAIDLRAITVCVDYHDLLGLTLPFTHRYFAEFWVVTSPADDKTKLLAREWGLSLLVTDLFYEDGADFNKWRALEWGLDQMGRHGWICLLDADVCWPRVIPQIDWQPGCLYTPLRRLAPMMLAVPDESQWQGYPVHPNVREWAGYSQIFHASDPHLGTSPWHDIDWRHAGGADSFFQAKWPQEKKIRPGFEVLHLGPCGVNWCGRASDYLDGSQAVESGERRERLHSYKASRRQSQDMLFASERLDSEHKNK